MKKCKIITSRIVKFKNRNHSYYRKDDNKLGNRKLERLEKLGLLPVFYGVPYMIFIDPIGSLSLTNIDDSRKFQSAIDRCKEKRKRKRVPKWIRINKNMQIWGVQRFVQE